MGFSLILCGLRTFGEAWVVGSTKGYKWGCNEAPFIRRCSVMLFYKFNGQVSKNTQNRKHHNYTQDYFFKKTKHTLLISCISNLLIETLSIACRNIFSLHS